MIHASLMHLRALQWFLGGFLIRFSIWCSAGKRGKTNFSGWKKSIDSEIISFISLWIKSHNRTKKRHFLWPLPHENIMSRHRHRSIFRIERNQNGCTFWVGETKYFRTHIIWKVNSAPTFSFLFKIKQTF